MEYGRICLLRFLLSLNHVYLPRRITVVAVTDVGGMRGSHPVSRASVVEARDGIVRASHRMGTAAALWESLL